MWQENEKESNAHMEYVVFAFVAAGLVVLLAAKGIYDSKSEKARILYRFRHKYGELRKNEYGLDRYKAIAGYFKHHGNEEQVDEITFQDLSMDDIFMQMNFTNCQAGEEVLYHLLRTPHFTEKPLAHKEAVIQYFEEHKKERVQLQYRLNETGYTGKFSLYDYLGQPGYSGKALQPTSLHTAYQLHSCHCILLFQPVSGYPAHSRSDDVRHDKLFQRKRRSGRVFKQLCIYLKAHGNLGKNRAALSRGYQRGTGQPAGKTEKHWDSLGGAPSRLMSNGRMSGSGNPLDMILDYLRMSLHFDLIKFNTMLEQVRKHTENVDGLFYTIGYLDAMVAIGEYRASLQNGYCIPVLPGGKGTVSLAWKKAITRFLTIR